MISTLLEASTIINVWLNTLHYNLVNHWNFQLAGCLSKCNKFGKITKKHRKKKDVRVDSLWLSYQKAYLRTFCNWLAEISYETKLPKWICLFHQPPILRIGLLSHKPRTLVDSWLSWKHFAWSRGTPLSFFFFFFQNNLEFHFTRELKYCWIQAYQGVTRNQPYRSVTVRGHQKEPNKRGKGLAREAAVLDECQRWSLDGLALTGLYLHDVQLYFGGELGQV